MLLKPDFGIDERTRNKFTVRNPSCSRRREPRNRDAIFDECRNLLSMHEMMNNIRHELLRRRPMEDQVVQMWVNVAIEKDPRIRRQICQTYRFHRRKRMPFAKHDHELAHTKQ